MANRTSKIVAALAWTLVLAPAAVAQSVEVEEPYYNWASRADGIALSGGNANRSNIAIQTPTPWPSYLNKTDFGIDGKSAEELMKVFYERHSKPAPGPSTVINIGTPATP